MSDSILVLVLLAGVALIEGANGTAFTFRAEKTLRSAGLTYHHGPGILIQEFGLHSLALALAYLLALLISPLRPGIIVAGVIINTGAACMHLARSAGVYFGGVVPGLSPRSERNQGLLHVLSASALGVAFLAAGTPGA